MPATRVYLSLGANQGDRLAALTEAYDRLAKLLAKPRLSRIYETEPMYLVEQPPFLNAVCEGRTELDARGLLDQTQRIEAALGRVRGIPKGPRTLDIDILLFGDVVLEGPELRVPHPGMRERAFVLVPLVEIAPDLKDPLTGRPYRVYLETLETAGVRPYAGGS